MSENKEKQYQITGVRSTVFLDATQTAVNGVEITFEIPEFNETHKINSATSDPVSVDTQIMAFIDDRQGLSSLG